MSIHPEPSEALVDLKTYRHKQQQNQSTFWLPLGVTQSGGSRYETDRIIPMPVAILLILREQGAITADQLDRVRSIIDAHHRDHVRL